MVFTHILVGILIGSLYMFVDPSTATVAVVAGLVGGGFPDVDMVFVHRKTLHYPILSYAVAALGLVVLVLIPHEVVVFVFISALAAAVHSSMDVLGGGKEMRPWEETDDRAVYNHVSGNWITPRRILYDGSVYDLLISLSAAFISWFLVPDVFRPLIVLLVITAGIYVLLRRWVTRRISNDFTTFSSFIQHHIGNLLNRIT